jgi:hypothetical protein
MKQDKKAFDKFQLILLEKIKKAQFQHRAFLSGLINV